MRDIVVDEAGFLDAFNGTSSPLLSRFLSSSNAFSASALMSGWNVINSPTNGGIGTFANFVYLTDMNAGGIATNGIIRFNTSTAAVTRFANGIDFLDLNIGLDRKLYALTTTHRINVYDPITLQFDHEVVFPAGVVDDIRSIAVDQNGRLFLCGTGGMVWRLSSGGTLETSQPTGFMNLSDIDVDESGRLIIGQQDGRVILGDVSLNSFSSFLAVTDPDVSSWTIFVSFARPVPGPDVTPTPTPTPSPTATATPTVTPT